MLNPNNLLILKKYNRSYHVYYTDKIFKKFIVELGFEFGKNLDDNNYKRLFTAIFIDNFVDYLYT